MQKFCSKCGTRLKPGTVVCPGCGKVIQQPRAKQPARPAPPPQRRPAPVRTQPPPAYRENPPQYRAAPPRSTQSSRQMPRMPRQEMPPRKPQPEKRRKASSKNRIVRRVIGLITAAVVIAAAYIIIFTVQVFRVRISSYPFDTPMKLSASNYGQAISSYFEDGRWSVNPFTGRCTYKGTSRHKEEYEIVFSAGLSVTLEEIIIDDEPVDEKLTEQKIMALFI